MSSLRDELKRWVVEQPTTDGQYRKVPLLDLVNEIIDEARQAQEEAIVAAVEALPELATFGGWMARKPGGEYLLRSAVIEAIRATSKKG